MKRKESQDRERETLTHTFNVSHYGVSSVTEIAVFSLDQRRVNWDIARRKLDQIKIGRKRESKKKEDEDRSVFLEKRHRNVHT